MGERELPEGWEWKRLGDVADIFNGVTPPKSEQRECGHPVLKIKDIDENGQFKDNQKSFVDNAFFLDNQKKILKNGDTLILNAAHSSDYVSSKKCYISNFPENIIATGEWMIIRSNSGSIDSKFIYFLLTSGSISLKIKTIVKGIHLYPKDMANLRIPLPPLSIQHQIVAVLERTEAMKRQRREADALTGALLQSVFREMFGDPERNERGWETKTLYDILSEDPQNGLYKPSSEYSDSGTPIVRIDSFYDGKIGDLRNLKRINCTEKEIAKYQIHEGDVLINRVNSLDFLGKCGLVQKIYENTIYECNMIRMRPNRTLVHPTYLTAFLCTQFVKNQILNRAKNAVNQASINQQDVKALNILIPPLALQQQFAHVVESVERIRDQQVASGRQIEGLCEGLMQRAFAGELVV